MTTTVVAAGGTYVLDAAYDEVLAAIGQGAVIEATTTCGGRVTINPAAIGVIAEGATTTTRREVGFTANWRD